MTREDQIGRLIAHPIDRRNFIQGGLAAAVLGSAAVSGVSCARDQVYRADYPSLPENQVRLPANGKSVLILGGGFGGIHAACELADRGFKVTVIEKSALLGGKLKSWRDKNFGVPPAADSNWPGYPRDHGIHAVWGSYNNLREFMGRHGYRLWKFPESSTVYNYVGRDGSHFQLGLQPSFSGYPGRIQSLFRTNRELGNLIGPEMGRMRSALLKMAAFDFSDRKQRRYLDSLSFPMWARAVGMPETAIYKFFGANSQMSMMDHIDNCSALSVLGLSSTVSGHPEDMRVDVFMHPPGETYIAPLERYLRARGGEIVFNTPVIKLNRDGSRIKSVTVGDEGFAAGAGANTWKCSVCGSAFYSPSRPGRCPVCGAAADQLSSFSPGPPREYSADYYILAMDLPGAKQVITQSGFPGESYYDNILKLQETGVFTVNIWYANCRSWKSRFPGQPNFFPSGFKYLGITMDLAGDGKINGKSIVKPLVPDYQNKDICVIETQIANTHLVEELNDDLIARLVHEELKIVMPDLPPPTDCYVNRWNNYSPQRVGDDARRPAIPSPLDNLFLIGDWVQTEHLSAYMEKAYVAAKIATNLLLDRIGQTQGRLTILPSGSPSAIIGACRSLFSVYP